MTLDPPHCATRFHRRVGGFDRVEDTAGDEGIEPPSSTRAVTRSELTVPGSDEPGYAHAAFRKMLGDGAHVLDGFGGHDLVQPLEDELPRSRPHPVGGVDQPGPETPDAHRSRDGKTAEDAARPGVLAAWDPLEAHVGKGPWLMEVGGGPFHGMVREKLVANDDEGVQGGDALRHQFPGDEDRGSPASWIPRHGGEPSEGRTKAWVLMITHPRRAVAEVEDEQVAAGAEFDLKVFPRTDEEALNHIVLPQVRDTRAGRLRRDVR